MTQRDKLMNLIIDAKRTDPETGSFTEHLADYLLDNGVIVLPCKVGDNVFALKTLCYGERLVVIDEDTVKQISINSRGMFLVDTCGRAIDIDLIGKTVFLTREEAEKALKERDGND